MFDKSTSNLFAKDIISSFELLMKGVIISILFSLKPNSTNFSLTNGLVLLKNLNICLNTVHILIFYHME